MAIIQQIYFFHPILMKLGCCCCLAWTLFVLAFQCHEKINWIFFFSDIIVQVSVAVQVHMYIQCMYMD